MTAASFKFDGRFVVGPRKRYDLFAKRGTDRYDVKLVLQTFVASEKSKAKDAREYDFKR